MDNFAHGFAMTKTVATLSRQQIAVLKHAADGHTAKQSARLMGLSFETVKDHRKLATKRIGAKNLLHAVVAADRAGVLS